MPTESKLAWMSVVSAARTANGEVASFVPPAAIPQMPDAAEVRTSHPALRVVGLACTHQPARLSLGYVVEGYIG